MSFPRDVGSDVVRGNNDPELVTVIMPARNAEATIQEALNALTGQDYGEAWEMLVVDNGSTDATRAIAMTFADRLPSLRIIDAGARAGVSYARNTGLAAARGDFVAICDADDAADPHWLTALARAAQSFDLVGGHCDRGRINDPNVVRVPASSEPALPHGLMDWALGANFGVWRQAALETGGWDEEFSLGGDDIDFAWRLQMKGFSLGLARDAVIYHRLKTNRQAAARQGFTYGRGDARLYARYRQLGATRLAIRPWLHSLAGLAASGLRYRRLTSPQRLDWWFELGRRTGRLRGSLENRVWCP